MKLTKQRIKEIIREEINKLQEKQEINVEPPPPAPENTSGAEEETKTLQALKQFMFQKSKEVPTLKNASAAEVKALAAFIDDLFAKLQSGAVERHIATANTLFNKRTGK